MCSKLHVDENASFLQYSLRIHLAVVTNIRQYFTNLNHQCASHSRCHSHVDGGVPIADRAEVALEVAYVDRVESNDSHEETDVGLRELVPNEVVLPD